MALNTNSGYNSGPLIFLSPRSKDKDKKDVPPHFEVGRVGPDGKIVNDAETVTNVSGDLFRIEFKEREFNGETFEEPVFYLKDSAVNESYRLPIRFGIPGRGLFNRMATLNDGTDFSNLQVDYYRNRNGYETFGLKQNGEPVKWKYENSEIPAALEIKHPTTGKVLQRDYTAPNAFFRNILQQIADKVNKVKPAGEAKHSPPNAPASGRSLHPTSPPPATASKTTATEDESMDVPF